MVSIVLAVQVCVIQASFFHFRSVFNERRAVAQMRRKNVAAGKWTPPVSKLFFIIYLEWKFFLKTVAVWLRRTFTIQIPPTQTLPLIDTLQQKDKGKNSALAFYDDFFRARTPTCYHLCQSAPFTTRLRCPPTQQHCIVLTSLARGTALYQTVTHIFTPLWRNETLIGVWEFPMRNSSFTDQGNAIDCGLRYSIQAVWAECVW